MSTSSSSSSSRRSRAARGLALLVSGAVYAALAGACASVPDSSRYTVIGQPDFVQFQGPGNHGVSYFLERRCGTLDCHGQPGRPLRIYGRDGLRLPNDGGNTPISNDTTAAEIQANYRAVVGLEPEEMRRVVVQKETPDVLMLIKKPLGYDPSTNPNSEGVRHKGGPVIARGSDPGYVCLRSWLQLAADEGACQTAAEALEK